MKAVQISAWGKEDVVKIEEVSMPKVGDNEVLIAVHAAAINPIDWKVREGYFAQMMQDPFPFRMGWDFSGTIISVGSHVNNFKPGDEVYGLPNFPKPAGSFAEYITAPANEIALKPAKMDHLHAAGVPLVTLTAWQALFETANIKPQQKILIHGAGGGVGQAAVQLAKWKNAFVIATGSLATKDLLLSLGVDQFINYQTESFQEKVQEVDLVLNLVGEEVLAGSLQVLKPGGELIDFTLPITPDVESVAKAKNIDAKFTIVKPNSKQLEEITHLIEDGLFKINIEKIFPLSQIKQALALQQQGHCHGKVILQIN